MTNPAQKKSLPAFAVLTIICLVAALALAATNAITKGPIQEHAMAAQREAFGMVMAADEYIEMTIPEGSGVSALVEAKKDGQTVGYCVVASTGGYAGPVAVTLGVDTDGKITGAKIGDTSFAETSGFGSRWLAEDQTEQFVGIDLKEGGTIEALSGATVTSTAVLNASNTALAAVNTLLGNDNAGPVLAFGVKEEKPVTYADSVAAGEYTASAQGFASEVKVTFTVDENSTITALTIDSTGETPDYGTRCTEDASFAAQFVGKTVPVQEFDVLAGASVTSKAVVSAINSVAQADEPAAAEVSAEPLPEGAMTASAKGLLSDVKVTITKNEDGTIATMTVDCSGETAGLTDACAGEEFLSQFIGKAGPFENIEVVSGATYTSNAVINAVNSLYAAEEEAPAAEGETASAKGLLSDVKVTITKNEDGTIATMTVDCSGETAGLTDACAGEEFLSQFIGKAGPFENIEVVSGATYTSNAVINAVNSLYAAEEEAPAAEGETASAKGLMSDVKVTITRNEDGTIATMTVDCSGETAGLTDACAGEEFLSQFIGKAGPFENIEVVSGATYTSNAVINAVNSLYAAEEEAPAGETLTGKAQGFQSEVTVTLTVEDGVITAIEVDSSNETPNFGTRCGEDEAYLSQFIGKKATPDLGEGVEALSGATVTSEAVIVAANAAIGVAVAEVEMDVEAPAANEMTASAKGLMSDVKVTITKNEDGTIATMTVDCSGETAGLTDACAGDEFLSQFIGKAGPFENIEVVSGATYTSTAVINAVNSMYPTQDMAVTDEAVAAYSAEQTVTVPGYDGQDVIVTVTLNGDGSIAALDVDASTQTPGLGSKCAEEAFTSQFVGKTGPFTLGEGIDAVSMATVTSQAVVDAVNSLLGE